MTLEQEINKIFDDITETTINLSNINELLRVDILHNKLLAINNIELKTLKNNLIQTSALLDVKIRQTSTEKLTENKVLNLISSDSEIVKIQDKITLLENNSYKLNAISNILTTYKNYVHFNKGMTSCG